MKINSLKWKEECLNSSLRLAFPILTHSGIEMIGKSVRDAVTHGEIHADAVCALGNRYPSLACSVIMDLTMEAEAFGAKIRFTDNEVPSVEERMLQSVEDIEKLAVPTLDKGRVMEYIKANQRIVERMDKPVISGCIGPYSLAGRLYDMSELMMAMFTDPDAIKTLLSKCTDFIIAYCKALKNVGSNGVLIAEPAAGLLSNEFCQEFSSVYVKQIIAAVEDENFLVFLHNCGNQGQCTDAMIATGASGYHFGNVIDMVSALEKCPSDALVMGNLDPVQLLKMGTADEVYDATMNLLNKTSKYKNFILSTGCDTPPEVPFENIDKFYQALNDYNAKIGQ